MIKDFSLLNYNKSFKIATKLGLHADAAKLFTNVVSNIPEFLQKSTLEVGLGIGLKLSANVIPLNGLKKFLDSEQKNSIRLLYPNIDFNYSQTHENDIHLKETWDEPNIIGR